MKSQVNVLLQVTRGILADVRAAYPSLKGLDLDFRTLTLLCRNRGLPVFTLDLPNLDSLLLAGLEAGRLLPEGPLSRCVSRKTKVPRLFSGLWKRVFDNDGCLKLEVDSLAIFFLRQLSCLGKKLATECSDNRIKATVGEYHGIERQLRNPSVRWASDSVDFEDGSSDRHLGESIAYRHSPGPLYSSEKEEEERLEELQLEVLLRKTQQVADLVAEAIGPFDAILFSEDLYHEDQGSGFKHGPGAVAERLKNGDKSLFPNWPQKLHGVFPFELVGKTAGSDRERPLNHEVASRLISVPKTAKAPRLIAAEPVAQQYCQQLVWSFLRRRCKRPILREFINFARQDLSSEMVVKSSLDRSLATVDLSSASDRLTCWTVERMFRRNPSLLHALHAARTRWIRDDISSSPSFLRLKKFASQGSATTFPVQSLVFLIIAIAASLKGPVRWSKIRHLVGQVRVYGDDIIIPSHGYAPLLAIMESLELKVNTSKSYVTGFFRESCGSEAYQGHDVTPVKPKTVVADGPTACQAIIDTCNNLFNKGLWHASDILLHTLPAYIQCRLRIMDQHTVGFSGLTCFSGSDETHLLRRWNRHLHRYECRVWKLRDQTRRGHRDGFHTLLDFFSRPYSSERARTVSDDSDGTRKARGGFHWEPLNPGAREAA
ncbi:TPA_asm: RNA-directed RNA polymerase [ssRNA phage Gephyllon.4_20]|uniref:RNA-directed RNA polymerase n=2 Tax=Leviviricetes TaxID=2842243 RepID=A0A8S5KZI9_9VIRU|nr:RNA-directed RNA polymerase [ssRNA phage Gephyllon.4_20]QDH89045.1 MAG: RNA-dependent RNA polymerase [Leviviridae sp.]DAD50493.1 TPA_asm: RNA-directed RNA polymerase [ssRNA phage Gephyllon.4_20]